VQLALQKLIAGRTTFIIAHRLSTIQSVDKIVVLDGGEAVQIGKHEDLLKEDGVYRRLYQAQRF
jgi:ABC-type multidrug transport system fused ATPase/permease subunit